MALATLAGKIADVTANIGGNFVAGLADFVVVLVLLGIGYIVAKFLSGLVKRGLKESGVEKKLEQKGIHDALIGFTFIDIVTTLTKVTTFAVFLGIAADVTRLGFLNTLVLWFIGYLPGLVEGIAIIMAALLLVDYVADRIKKAEDIPFPGTLAVMTKVFVGYTALVIAMPLILPGADVEILKTFFTLLVGAFAVAVGFGGAIALGLGLKDTVAAVAKERKGELKKLIG